MVMHFGVLAAKSPWPRLRARLEERTGPWTDFEAIASEPASQEGSAVLAGEHDERAFVVDGDLLLTSMNPDLFVNLSSELGTLVVGAGAETTSGTFWLVAADAGHVLRHYHECDMCLSHVLDRGRPLPSERRVPLHQGDGHGVRAALDELGFDLPPEAHQRDLHQYEMPLAADAPWERESSHADLRVVQAAHDARYMLPREQWRMPTHMQDPDTGALIPLGSQPPPRGRGWAARFRAWLRDHL